MLLIELKPWNPDQLSSMFSQVYLQPYEGEVVIGQPLFARTRLAWRILMRSASGRASGKWLDAAFWCAWTGFHL
jgi:hypothetical protein